MSPPPSLGWVPPVAGFPTRVGTSLLKGVPRAELGVVPPPKTLRHLPRSLPCPFSSFQVPWFETIPIAVSNDISEQSLEEFSQEVRQSQSELGRHLGFCWIH